MYLHPDKCFAVCYGLSTQGVPEYSIDGKPIQSTNMHRDLSIIMSGNLSWSSHYDHMFQSLFISVSYKVIFFCGFIILPEETTIPVNSPLTLVLLLSSVEVQAH